MQIETEAQAKAGVDSDYVPPPDLAVMTSVKANIDIPKPRVTRKLTVKLTGKLDPKMAISDSWQTVTWLDPVDGASSAEFKIESKAFDMKDSVERPITAPEFAPFLKSTPYLDVDSPEVKAQAAQIVGNDNSAYGAALKIRAWVSANMKPQADMGVVRPAVDILKEKSGVCRDYAVLFASLSRASGVPCKVIAGLVYIDGGFYYHAWNECYVGRWVAFDSTLGRDYCDATHIKLAEGEATNMFDLATVFGSLKADIINFR
jgi:transglutaminase-like putative cysteine protease